MIAVVNCRMRSVKGRHVSWNTWVLSAATRRPSPAMPSVGLSRFWGSDAECAVAPDGLVADLFVELVRARFGQRRGPDSSAEPHFNVVERKMLCVGNQA